MGSHVIRPPFTSGINRFQTHHISVELEVNNWEVIGLGSKGTDLFNRPIWSFLNLIFK
jgi:hypothetical protein